MKKINYFLIPLFSVILIMASCSKDYLDTKPTNAIGESEAFATISNANAALNGIHRAMFMQYSNQNEAGFGSLMINYDMLGEDLVMSALGNGWFNAQHQWTGHRNVNDGFIYFAWRFYYKIIANANMILANIDNVKAPVLEKNAIKGEALAYRAWAHFMLVQTFAKRYDWTAKPNSQMGVPVMIKNSIDGLARNTVEEVYTQVNADLDSAMKNLTGVKARAAKSHFNLNVVKGLKARVALTTGDWPTAAQMASEARTGFSLMSNADYQAGFNNVANSEWMWGSDQVDDQTTYFYSFFAYMSANFNSTNIRTNPKLINSKLYACVPKTDIRKAVFDSLGTSTVIPPNGAKVKYAAKKFLASSSSSSVGDVPYMRAAEMYLIEAEARARNGENALAAQALFTLNKNRNASYVLSTKVGQSLIDEIMIYRRVELWGEGFRYLDLKRLNLDLNRTGANHNPALALTLTVPAGDVRWEFFIPKAELDANKAISEQQNP